MESNNNYETISDVASTFIGSTRSTTRGNLFKKAVNKKIENGDIVFEKVEGTAGCHYIRLPHQEIDPEVKSSNQYATMSQSSFLKRPLKQAVLTFVEHIDDLNKPQGLIYFQNLVLHSDYIKEQILRSGRSKFQKSIQTLSHNYKQPFTIIWQQEGYVQTLEHGLLQVEVFQGNDLIKYIDKFLRSEVVNQHYIIDNGVLLELHVYQYPSVNLSKFLDFQISKDNPVLIKQWLHQQLVELVEEFHSKNISFGGQITVESLRFSRRSQRGVYISAANYAYYNIQFDSALYTSDDLLFQIGGWEHGYDPCLLLNRNKGRQLSANMMKQADYAGLKKTLATLAFEVDKSDQDLSISLANVLVKYSLSELVHKLLEGNTTQEALLIDPEINEIHLKQLFYVENIETQTEAFLKYLYRTNNVERLREYANTCESAVGYLARLGHVYLDEFQLPHTGDWVEAYVLLRLVQNGEHQHEERLNRLGRFLDLIDQALVLEQIGGEHYNHALQISEQIEFSQLGEKCLQLRAK